MISNLNLWIYYISILGKKNKQLEKWLIYIFNCRLFQKFREWVFEHFHRKINLFLRISWSKSKNITILINISLWSILLSGFFNKFTDAKLKMSLLVRKILRYPRCLWLIFSKLLQISKSIKYTFISYTHWGKNIFLQIIWHFWKIIV